MASRHEIVLVTGGTGFIALHLVKQLLESGRTVHATVRSLANEKRNAPLVALGAPYPDKLKLFEADLTHGADAFAAALVGVDAVQHTASPFHGNSTPENAQKEVVEPAVNGTLAILTAAAKVESVRKVVVTSSFAAVMNPTKSGATYTEEDWNDVSTAEMGGFGAYCYSKTAAERAAWAFVEEHKPSFELITMNPPYVFGENLAPVSSVSELNTSSSAYLPYLNGVHKTVPSGAMAIIDVEDLARAHILGMDNPDAKGRFLVAAGSVTNNEFAAILRELYPEYPIPTEEAEPTPGKSTLINKKSKEVLGLEYRPIRDTIRIQADSLIKMGLVNKPGAN